MMMIMMLVDGGGDGDDGDDGENDDVFVDGNGGEGMRGGG